MKKIIKKHWALLGLLATVYVDHAYDILSSSGLSESAIKLIHLSGVIIVGYFWNPKISQSHELSARRGNGAILPSKGL